MSVKIAYQDEKLTIFEYSGKTDSKELLELLITFYEKFPTQLVIHDGRNGDLLHWTDSELRNIVQRTVKYAPKRKNAKSAYVYGEGTFRSSAIAKAFAGIFASILITIQYFSSMEEARAWLGV